MSQQKKGSPFAIQHTVSPEIGENSYHAQSRAMLLLAITHNCTILL